MTYSTSYTPTGDYLLDWDLTGADGSAQLVSSSGADPVGVTVSTPDNGDDDEFRLKYGELKSDDVEEPTRAVITFDTAVTDLNFQIKDIDQGHDWDDKVTILAYDANGDLVDVDFSDLQAEQTVSGNTIEGGTKLDEEGMTVSIAGPIVELVIIHYHGGSDDESGHIKITDMGFNAVHDTRDGIVEGTAGDDLIDLAYDGDPDGDMVDAGDAILSGAAPDDDVIVAGAGNDTVYAGAGDDTVFGGAGDDVIYGDSGAAETVTLRESLNWSEAPNFGSGTDADGFTQNTGNVDVTFSILTETGHTDSRFEVTTQNTDGIVDDGDPVDDDSSFESITNGEGNEGDYQLAFSDPVSNVSFRINDIDGDGLVRVTAYDADDNVIRVDMTGGSKLSLLDTDSVPGADTADSKGGYLDDDAPEYSVLVGIAGPVARIVIEHDQDGSGNSGINITDVFFDVEVSDGTPQEGNDTLYGNDGDDVIHGEGGDDLIYGGAGDDTIHGGDGNDTIHGDDETCETGGKTGDLFPTWEQDISNIVFYFDTDGDGEHDRAIKIDGFPEGGTPTHISNDLDDFYAQMHGFIVAENPELEGASVVLGVSIKGGVQPTEFYAVDADGNGALPDDGPTMNTGSGTETLLYSDFYATYDPAASGTTGEAGAYDDVIDGGAGDDLIFGGAGNDVIEGGAGDDTIYGDYGPGTPGAPGEAKTLVWENVAADGTHPGGSTDYDAGGINVNIAFSALDHGASATISDDTVYTEAGEGLDPDSSLMLYGVGSDGGFEDTSLTSLAFSATDSAYGDEVQNVFFRLNDVDTGYSADDHIDRVTVRAFDAEGNAVDVVLTPTGVQDVDGNTVTGTSPDEGNVDPEDALGSVEVAIAGPVARVEILYQNGEATDQAIWVSDVTFETTAPDGEHCPPGDDVITGGAGADVMHGEGGNDTFIVASAEDGAGDVIVGGNGPDEDTDHDVLDLRGAGKVTIDKIEDDTDAGAYKGTVTFENGDTLGFSQIEEFLTDPQNEAPMAMDDDATTDEDTAVVIDVLANDSDPDGDLLTVTEATSPDGMVEINPDGTLTFTPDENFNGSTTIAYTVSDGNGGTDTATVSVEVTPVNDAPVAGDDSTSTDEDTAVVIDVLANDSDVDGDMLEVTEVGDPSNGTVEINPDGTLTYTPDPDYNGPDSFTYTVSDGNGGTDTATVNIDVTPVNDAPVAEDDAGRTPINTPVVISVLANDSDPDGDPLNVISASSPDGSVDINPDGTITFTPGTDFFGETTIDYTISDGNGGTDSAVVTLMVNDGIVSGTVGDDLIDVNYMDDPEGDMVDANDAILPGAQPNDDVILAGDGDDTVFAGLGDDHIVGGAGDDVIHGEDGNDTIIGGDGSDTVYGGAGDDYIDTSGSNPASDYGFPPLVPEDSDKFDDRDYVEGGDGNDTILTGDDQDTIHGGAGDDTIDGGLDDDLIYGDAGNDTIIGGHGSDTIHGGDGDDVIYGGLGPDPSLDPLNLPDDIDPRPDNGIDVIYGGAGNDTIYGQDDADILYGDEGDDFIDGGIDNDTIYGGEGNDELHGGAGSDLIDGGAGNDEMYGGDDRDSFVNVNADDLIYGGEGGDDFDTLDLNGSAPNNGSLKVTYTSADKEDGFVSYFDENGDAAGTLNFYEIENVIPCFTPGTMIATPKGERRVEELKAGDRVITRDNGIQEIKWVGHKPIGFKELAVSDHLKPVLIRAGALGNGLPERDMMVSPNHRVLVANDRTTLYFDEREVLAAAKHLVDNKGIMTVEPLGVTYLHFMFEHHEVVLSDGAWTESFQPGDHSLKGIGNAQRQELFELFPELDTRDGIEDYTAARRILKKHEARMLVGE
ncbi:Ig-like domain-containing protein [Sinisalibacter lacisalsi]|uniref:Cadherin domain-containing protein n=1 Tax=Sinisalibacter lacisalsi TaxID=1526570 RepID=A0ABQ1QL86_9RHOB|nr:tandem-95 repeat protein [Sinisalibacter lacisalsi]GGD32703.1 hypothetical protein GCM10011358_16060 [Sinisalibacter lacisalsi]